MLGVWVEDERDQAGMPRGEANKNALSSSTVPIGNLLAILKAGVKSCDTLVVLGVCLMTDIPSLIILVCSGCNVFSV